jgi:hypothetical protein
MADKCCRCGGSGLYMGNGMIMTECNLCVDDEYPVKKELPSLDKIDRRSKSYNNAINDIMKASSISRNEAVKVFDETYDKI